MTHDQIVTLCVVFAAFLFLVLYDVWIYMKKGDEATISRSALKLSRAWLIVPLIAGIILGHILWPNCGDPPKAVNKVECARAGDK